MHRCECTACSFQSRGVFQKDATCPICGAPMRVTKEAYTSGNSYTGEQSATQQVQATPSTPPENSPRISSPAASAEQLRSAIANRLHSEVGWDSELERLAKGYAWALKSKGSTPSEVIVALTSLGISKAGAKSVVRGAKPSDATLQAPDVKTTSAQVETYSNGPVVWKILKVVFSLLYATSGLVWITGIAFAVAIYWQPGASFPLGIIWELALTGAGICLAVFFAWLARAASRKAALPPNDKPFDELHVTVIVGTAIAVCAPFLGIGVLGVIGALVVGFGSLFLAIRLKEFRWRDFLVFGLAPSLALIPILIPAILRAQEMTDVIRRN